MAEPWLPWNRPRPVPQPPPPGMASKPWFQARLPSRCLAKHRRDELRFPSALDGRRWVFLRPGLDDFRAGCPPFDGMILRGPREGFLPTISHGRGPGRRRGKACRVFSSPCRVFSSPCRVFSSACRVFSSSRSPAQQARRVFVERTEENLSRHPLAFWPLEEGISADLFLNVLEALDPERKLEAKRGDGEGRGEWVDLPAAAAEKFAERRPPPKTQCPPPKPECLPPKTERPPPKPERPPPKSERPPPKTERPPPKTDWDAPRFPGSRKHGVRQEKNPKNQDSGESLYYRHIPKGVSEFCEWVDSFGDLGIDADLMMQQFDIGYECRPRYGDAAIARVSLLSPELRSCRRLSRVREIRFSIQEANVERRLRRPRRPRDPYKSTREKVRYGAWYLRPELWKKLVNEEPLLDPEELLEIPGPRPGKPDIIEDLYGTIAFKDFIVGRGYRMPGILEKLFVRKGWAYDTVNTPIPRVLKAHELIMQKKDEDYDDEND